MSASGITAHELEQLQTTLRTNLLETNPEDYYGIEIISREFFKLNIPVEAEILDVAAGSGLTSVNLQRNGYINLDALDEDLPTLNTLQALRLYRNYIWRGVTGINSTGLREESYDVITSAGGICSSGISPHDITEMLRLLKVDGYLLLTMRTASREGNSEFGLFDTNLACLEEEGKCQLVRKDLVTDSGSIPTGVFYVVRRTASHLPDYLDQEFSEEQGRRMIEKLEEDCDHEAKIKFFDEWSSKYDKDLVVVGNYTGHIKCVDAFLKLELSHNVQILDVAAGTGLVGAEVAKHGYEFVDALDSSKGMLAQARKNGIYKNYIPAKVDKLGSIPVSDETYDVILMSNGFAPGQIYPSSLPELLRVLRPAGYLLWTMKDGFQTTSQQFAMMDHDIKDLVSQGSAELLVGPIILQKYILEIPGRFYMLRKSSKPQYAVGSPKLTRRRNSWFN